MSPEAQRRAIFKACGWGMVKKRGRWRPTHHIFADPLNDLNAMHDAEELMAFEMPVRVFKKYHEILSDIATPRFSIMASADQRAKAFLKTIGKWDDSK